MQASRAELRAMLREAEEDLRHWQDLAVRQRTELPVNSLPAMPSDLGIQVTQDIRARIKLLLAQE